MPDQDPMNSRDVIQLLVEIRNGQREYLEEYRRVTQEALQRGRRAIQLQEQIGRLYRRVIAGVTVALVAAGFYPAWAAGVFH